MNVVRSRALAVAFILLLALPVVTALPAVLASSPSTSAVPPLHGYKLLGSAPPNLPVLVTLALPLRNLGALDTLVMQVSDPASPMYRHFLTPQQVRSDFLPTAAYDSLLSFLEGNGFQVEMTALDSEIVAEGTVSQFQSALGATIDAYSNGTYSYYTSVGASSFQGAYLYASNATFLYMKPAVLSDPVPNANVTFTSSSFSPKQLQPVYNATYFYSHGYDGAGQTIGLLDYYGSPTISSDLSLFDSTFGFPEAHLNVIPVGPYDPNLGANVGWSTEVSLDVEVSHAMAPGATIDLYVANGALPVSVPLAKIVQDDNVTSLSQSFGTPEWYFSISSYLGGASYFALNTIVPDQYYALGSVEGISFLASTGDGGGSGFSSGPEGDLEYPATSPFVTAVGGTQTYFASSLPNSSFVQTAWSNIGFVPNGVNEGGGGGGVSILEPKPWYQSNETTPPSFPNGRLNPDLSLQAGIDPATEIVDAGKVVGEGGTSESSPLLAGLLTLVAESLKGELGLVNPFIYQVGSEATQYQRGFSPVTFGYTIPWKASYGYNLATGWGSPNMGELVSLIRASVARPQLTVQGELFNKSGLGQIEFTPGQLLNVSARITNAGVAVTKGSFTISLETLTGVSPSSSMTYSKATGNWTGSLTVGQESGIAYLRLTGSSGGVTAEALGVVFTGYLGSFTVTGSIYALPTDPWSWSHSSPLNLTVYTLTLLGKHAPAGRLTMEVRPYSISTNTYDGAGTVTLTNGGNGSAVGSISTPVPAGPLSLILDGAVYGYAPTVYGIYLQSSYIYPAVAAEPGAVAPGQYLTVISNPVPPVNVYFETSLETGREFAYDVLVGSNVTASLVSPSGKNVSSAGLSYQPCAQALRVCDGGADVIYGQLRVPPGSTPGLYTVMLHASYGSFTEGGNLTGNFFGQVLVSGPMLTPSVSVQQVLQPSTANAVPNGTLYQGEQARIVAKITYSNSTAVRYGEFSAMIYPESLEGQYTSLMHSEYAGGQLVQLGYDPATRDWVGNATLPSSSNQGAAAGLGVNVFDYSGPWEAFVTGMTADGTPTSSELQAQQPFFIQPYVYTTGSVSSLTPGSSLAFVGANISASGSLDGDIFLGNNTVDRATVTISDSRIQGGLNLVDSNVTLAGVTGGQVTVNGSILSLRDSTVTSLTVGGGNLTVSDSSYGTVSPALPVISVGGLSKPIGGVAKYDVNVTGSLLSNGSLAAWVDGNQVSLKVNSTASGLSALGVVNATSVNDGVHSLKLVATQSDGLSSTYSTSFSTDAHQLSLESKASTLFDIAYALAAVSVLALVVGILAFMRRRSSPQV